ncbi:MAG: hypothetical protein AAF581_21065 [Planctomycetota bacterium]
MTVPQPPTAIEDLEDFLAAFTNYEQQRSLPTDRRALGPARAEALLHASRLLPVPQQVIQIAGSKGKGSTLLYVEALLQRRGARPGAYSSPHLQRINERIRVDGRDSTDDEILNGLATLHPAILAAELAPTFFDLWTVLATQIFKEHQLTHALFEVGLGGPLDSTSAVPHDVGVLTTIDLEHRELLGDTHEAIATEKALIARPGTPFVISEPTTPWGQAAAEVARDRGATPISVQRDARIPDDLDEAWGTNLATALAVVEDALGYATFAASDVQEVVESTRLPGRLELIRNPPLLIDCAHTPRSMEVFREAFERWRKGRPGTILCGFLGDKEWRPILELFPVDPDLAWIITTPNATRRLDPKPVLEFLRNRYPSVLFREDPQEALSLLREAAPHTAAAVTGSFHLAGLALGDW